MKNSTQTFGNRSGKSTRPATKLNGSIRTGSKDHAEPTMSVGKGRGSKGNSGPEFQETPGKL